MSTVNTAATVTIASGQTVSNAIDLGEMCLCGVQTPSALTSTAFTFQGSSDNSTFCAMTSQDGTAITAVVAASKLLMLAPANFAGVRFLKVVGGTVEGADRNIILLVRAV